MRYAARKAAIRPSGRTAGRSGSPDRLTRGPRVAIRKGDVLSVSSTYDSRRASWYESMAIMPPAITTKPAGGVNPFRTKVDVKGVLTHGHLPENNTHGGAKGALRNALTLPDGPAASTVDISSFLYGQGDLSSPGRKGLPPVVAPGQPLTFVNDDASRTIYHTITACRQPCTATTGIAYPLANGRATFDSAELGFGRWPSPPPPTATTTADPSSQCAVRSLVLSVALWVAVTSGVIASTAGRSACWA